MFITRYVPLQVITLGILIRRTGNRTGVVILDCANVFNGLFFIQLLVHSASRRRFLFSSFYGSCDFVKSVLSVIITTSLLCFKEEKEKIVAYKFFL